MDRVGHPLDDPGQQIEDPDPRVEGPVDHGGHSLIGPALGGHVDRLDHRSGIQGHRQQFRSLDDQGALRAPKAPLAEELSESADPLVGVGQSDLTQDPVSAPAGAAASASLATWTREAKASGSVTARSASTLRSTSTSARWRPAINRL